MADLNQVLNMLATLGVKYQVINHPPVYTAQEADQYVQDYDFVKAKNLFLRAKSGYYLVIMPDDRRLDMKSLRSKLDSGRLSFAHDTDLEAKLGVHAGAVSPFNLLNNQDHDVTVVLDQAISKQSGRLIGCHPNDNTKTVLLTVGDLTRLIRQWGNPLITIPL